MGQPLLVGDLVRPTVEFVRQWTSVCSDRHVYGPNFVARRPALVVNLLDSSGGCYVAFRLKNGKWKQPAVTQFRCDAFELIHRPASSHLLNPFNVSHPVPVNQDVGVHLGRTFYAIVPRISRYCVIDPDVAVIIGDRPVVPEVLGRGIRSSVEAIASHARTRADGQCEQPSSNVVQARATAAYKAALNELRTRYKVATPYPFDSDGSIVNVRQLHDCFRFAPTTQGGGGHGPQCREAWQYIGLGCTDRELGELTLAMLNQPNVATEHAARTDPFVGRVLPYIDLDALEAEMRRHWAA